MGNRASSAVLRGRRMAERLMIMRVTIDRVAGREVDSTGKSKTIYERVYDGKGKLQSFAGYAQDVPVAEHSSVIQQMTVHLPVGEYRSEVGDVVTVVSAPLDKQLEGRQYRVTQEAPIKTFATAYRIFVDYKAA